MNEVYAFLAGLLENGGFIHPDGVILTLDRDVAQNLTNRLGVGLVQPGSRGKFSWVVEDPTVFQPLLQSVLPYLGQRRKMDAQRVLYGG